MARIRVIPEQLDALGGHMDSVVGGLQSVERTIGRSLNSLDWEVRFQAGVEDLVSEARMRAAALSSLSSELAHFLRDKADAFTQADRSGVEGIGTAIGDTVGIRLPLHLHERLENPIIRALGPLWGLGGVLGALSAIPRLTDLLWFLKDRPKVLHDLLVTAKTDWWRAKLADDQAAMNAAHQRAQLLRSLGAKVTEDEERSINQMYEAQLRQKQQEQKPPDEAPPVSSGSLVLTDIPLLKQAGQPWSSIPFTPTRSWAEWGCTATAMVMALKHVDPSLAVDLEFMKRFRKYVVNQDGAVEWDSAGTQMLMQEHGAHIDLLWPKGQTGVMEMAVENLRKGVPSILGMSKADKSHWVLVTGFTGNPADPRPEDFLIHDPGADRTTLAEYFHAYGDCEVDKIVTITKAE